MRRARKGSNRPRTERPGRGGGGSSDDYGRSTHPEVAPSHGRPAREHRVGLRPDDERAHGARATGAARAIARARISSVPTTTSAGESNTRETISTSAREKLSHEAKLSPTRPLRPPSPPEAGARWDGAARDSSAGPHVGRRARRDRVRGDSAQLGAPVLGGDGVVERQDEARSKARRDASAPRLRAPLPELPHHLRTRASFAFADAANPSPFLPPPLRAQAAAHRTSRGRLGDDRRARSRGVPRRVPRADPSHTSRPRRRALRVRDRRARARLASRGGFADPAGFARRRGRRRRGGQGLRVRPGVGGGGGRARRPVPAARGRQEHPGRHERQVQRHLRAHGRRGFAEGRRRRRRPVKERGAAEPESRVRRYRNRRRGREAPNATRVGNPSSRGTTAPRESVCVGSSPSKRSRLYRT